MQPITTTTRKNHSLLELTAQIVAAHVAHNPVQHSKLPELIRAVHKSLADLQAAAALNQAAHATNERQREALSREPLLRGHWH
jgi:predicted transcriptional regulator